MARLKSIYRYPVKGLSPEKLDRVQPDRQAPTSPATACSRSRTAPPASIRRPRVHLPKTKFLMLMRDERLATLRTRYDDATGTLSIHQDEPRGRARRSRHEGRPPGGRGLLPPLHAARAARPARRCCSARGPSVSRMSPPRWSRSSIWPRSPSSKPSLALPVNPLRFRANLYVAGWPAWQRVRSGRTASSPSAPRGSRSQADRALRGHQRRSGYRHPRSDNSGDPDANFDHMDCGIYAQVIEGGCRHRAEVIRNIGVREFSP